MLIVKFCDSIKLSRQRDLTGVPGATMTREKKKTSERTAAGGLYYSCVY
jgi:hypothetical protein